MDDIAELEAEYCPPLDPALFSAIASDYDLTAPDALREARATLDPLKECAALEEAAGFDPSGASGDGFQHIAGDEAPAREGSSSETVESQSRDTDLSSVSNGMSSLDLADERNGGDNGERLDLEDLDDDAKVMLLRDLFGEHVSSYSIRHTLRKCGGNWHSAMEELLNHVYFGQISDGEAGTKVSAKGVDGFSEENAFRRAKKHKKLKDRRSKELTEHEDDTSPASPSDVGFPTRNKWQAASEDIDFIASRTSISAVTVRSTYNEHGASVPRTINALLKQTAPARADRALPDDDIISVLAIELGVDFPTIAPPYLTALIRLTHPSTAAAHELAKALVARPVEGSLEVVPKYARPSSQDLNGPLAWHTVSREQRSSASTGWGSADETSTASPGISYTAAREQAFSQASAAHRRAKSNRLMGGAAAYYSQVGREYSALSLAATASAADALAKAQSTNTQLDLHGIDVLNGVRIARDMVHEWWAGLGENRVNGRVGAADRGAGYCLVVGRGRHSEGGKGKLGPAVTKMLKAEGWRYENDGAVIVVKGKQRP